VPEFIDPIIAKTSPKRSFLVIENERFGLVITKTGSINSGTAHFHQRRIPSQSCPPSQQTCSFQPHMIYTCLLQHETPTLGVRTLTWCKRLNSQKIKEILYFPKEPAYKFLFHNPRFHVAFHKRRAIVSEFWFKAFCSSRFQDPKAGLDFHQDYCWFWSIQAHY
jgi:hypothetical protein